MEEFVVIRQRRGMKPEIIKVRGKSLEAIVKKVALEAVREWDPRNSDLVITRDFHTVALDLPLSKEDFNRFRVYGLRRAGSKAFFDLPMYEISNDNDWQENRIDLRNIVIIAPYVNESVIKELLEYVTAALEEVS